MSSNRELPYIEFDPDDAWDPERINDMQSKVRKNINDRVREGLDTIYHVSEADLAAKAKWAEQARRADSAECADHAQKASEAEEAEKAKWADKAGEAECAKTAASADRAAIATDAEHAQLADRATNADAATTATKADEASRATLADKATLADNASRADLALVATKADWAANADEAKHALVADEATHAAQADSATQANNAAMAQKAVEADLAARATKAVDAERAQNAERANLADKANYADKAGSAVTADSASRASSAAQADNAKEAGHAMKADWAGNADNAKDAAHATSADHAHTAGQAKTADSANSATSATTATMADKAKHADTADHAKKADEATTATKAGDATLLAGQTPDQLMRDIITAALAEMKKQHTYYGWYFKRVRMDHQSLIKHGMGRFPLVDVYQLDYFKVVSPEDGKTHVTWVNFYLYHSSEDRIRHSSGSIEIEPSNEEPFYIPLADFLDLLEIDYDDKRGIDDIENDIWRALDEREGNDRFDDTHHTSSPWFSGCCRQSLRVGELKKRGDWDDLRVQLRPRKTINLTVTSEDNKPMPNQIEVAQLSLNTIGLQLLGKTVYRKAITGATDGDWKTSIETELPLLVLLKA
jgi:hypothetical protein